jgi:hypothetical protein
MVDQRKGRGETKKNKNGKILPGKGYQNADLSGDKQSDSALS